LKEIRRRGTCPAPNRNTTLKPTHFAAALVTAALLAACGDNVTGVRFTKDGGGSSGGKPQVQAIRALTAGEIQAAISGKTFQYTRDDGNGFITYNTDGTFSYEDDTKGGGTGTWSASDGQFCEQFGQAPQVCGEFKTTGDAYFAAKSRLVEMKV
jgi:hypothetical protein